MIDLFSSEMRRNPFPAYDHLRKHSPLLHNPGADLWMIFDYATVKQALNEPETFSSRASPQGGGALDWLIFFDPPRHTKLRALIARAFTPRVVADLEPRIRALSRDLLNRVLERGALDLAAEFAVPLPMLVIAEMLGIPAEDRPRFQRWGDAMLGLSETVSGSHEDAVLAGKQFAAATAEMDAYLIGLLAERRARPQDDLLTRLVEAEVDGDKLRHVEIRSFFQLLLLAGTETTTNLINNAILCFLECPDQLAHLRASPELLPLAIEEVLRYRAPVQAMFRQTKRAVTIHGQPVPAGKLVLVMLGSANRDPEQFSDANRFDIQRDPNPHVSFGHGIHFCLGAPLARLEARVALTELLANLQDFALAGDGRWEPRKAFHVHGPSRLPIRFERSKQL